MQRDQLTVLWRSPDPSQEFGCCVWTFRLIGTTFIIEMMHDDDDDEGQSYSEDLGINRRLFSGPKITGGGQARHRAKLRI